jgi:hypothetical protein
MKLPWQSFYCQVAVTDVLAASVNPQNSYTVLDLLPDLGGEPFATRFFKVVSFEILFAPLVALTAPLSVQALTPMLQASNGINGNVTCQYIPSGDQLTLSPTTSVRMVVKPTMSKDFIWAMDATNQFLLQLRYTNAFSVVISPYMTIKTNILMSPDFSAGTV